MIVLDRNGAQVRIGDVVRVVGVPNLSGMAGFLPWRNRDSCQILPSQLTLAHEHNEYLFTRRAQVLCGCAG